MNHKYHDKASFGRNSAPLIFVALVTTAVHLLMATQFGKYCIGFLLCLSYLLRQTNMNGLHGHEACLQGFEGHSLFPLTDLMAL